jgi:putative endonuclease
MREDGSRVGIRIFVIAKMSLLFQIQKSTVILSAAKDLQFSPSRVIRGFRCWAHHGTAMREQKCYYVYIVASRSRTLYIGITSKLEQRAVQHKTHALPGFSSKYRCERLVFIERYADPQTAITREKQLKGWLRVRKIALIEENNPAWTDLSEGWGKPLT